MRLEDDTEWLLISGHIEISVGDIFNIYTFVFHILIIPVAKPTFKNCFFLFNVLWFQVTQVTCIITYMYVYIIVMLYKIKPTHFHNRSKYY